MCEKSNNPRTDKKTDDIVEQDEEDDKVRFTLIDVLRMLLGLILLASILSKLCLGTWAPKFKSKVVARSLKPSSYWDDFKLPLHFSSDELGRYTGDTTDTPILLAVEEHVFDVSSGSSFYGPWGPYKKFTGKDCSRLFSCGMWDLQGLNQPCSSSLEGLNDKRLFRVHSWLDFFKKKYPLIGYTKNE